MHRRNNPHRGPRAMIAVIYFWRIDALRAPLAIWHMAADRQKLKKDSQVTFFKLLGTGTGKTFSPRDADPTLWGLVVTMKESNLAAFDDGEVVLGWRKFARSEARFLATPISAHGQWSGTQPFEIDPDLAKNWEGRVLALTRARIRLSKNLQFWRAVPPVTTSLRGSEGVEMAFGIGEAPLGLQGTFSIWRDREAVRTFAYKGVAHADAIRKTQSQKWYSEELFARFALLEVRGSITSAK